MKFPDMGKVFFDNQLHLLIYLILYLKIKNLKMQDWGYGSSGGPVPSKLKALSLIFSIEKKQEGFKMGIGGSCL
jgi:hypothetical protein